MVVTNGEDQEKDQRQVDKTVKFQMIRKRKNWQTSEEKIKVGSN